MLVRMLRRNQGSSTARILPHRDALPALGGSNGLFSTAEKLLALLERLHRALWAQ